MPIAMKTKLMQQKQGRVRKIFSDQLAPPEDDQSQVHALGESFRPKKRESVK